jgi:hypothetical protein
VELFETITFLRETKMNVASLGLRVRSRFQSSLVFFLGNLYRPDTATLAPFTPPSTFREDRYINANIHETQLVSDSQLNSPSVIFYLSTGINLGRHSPVSLLLKFRPSSRTPIVTLRLNGSNFNSFLESSPFAKLCFTKSL